MTRGTFLLYTEHDIYASTEFNGDMYFEGYGKEAAEKIQAVSTPGALLHMVKDFNKGRHDYPPEEVGVYMKANEETYGDYLDFDDYAKKFFSDYLFIKNQSGRPLYFKARDGRTYKLVDGATGVSHFGRVAERFPDSTNQFLLCK